MTSMSRRSASATASTRHALQDVDLDGSGTPILVADFDALLDTLLTVVGGDTPGNVLDNDTPGDGGFQIVSIDGGRRDLHL